MHRQLPNDPLEDCPRYSQRAALAPVNKDTRLFLKNADDGPARVAHELRDFGYGQDFGLTWSVFHCVLFSCINFQN
jgi:hypothetical protein